MTSIKRIISQVNDRTPRSKLVSSRREVSRSAIVPKRVRVPVLMTRPRAVPLVTLLPRKQALGRSPAARSAVGGLLDRHRLAGQGRLTDEEILDGEQPEIGGDDGTGVEDHDVAGNDLGDLDLLFLPLTQDQGTRLHPPAERLHRLAGAAIEDVGESDAQDHHGADDRGGLELADDARHNGDDQELNDQRALAPMVDVGPEAQLRAAREFVGAVLREAALGLLGGQA